MEDDEEDTEAGIHDRVQGTSGQASEDGEVDWFGSEGTGVGRTNTAQLGKVGSDRQT